MVRAATRVASQKPPYGLKLLIQSQIAPKKCADPDVYPFAAFLAQMFDCTHAIVLGKPTAPEFMQLLPHLEIIGVVDGAEAVHCREQFPLATWIAADLSAAARIELPDEVLARALIICPRTIDKFEKPTHFLLKLRSWLDHAPVCLMTAGRNDGGAVDNNGSASLSGKWDIETLARLLITSGLNLTFIGQAASENVCGKKETVLAILQNNASPKPCETVAPPEFRVVAFMAAYNEEDIIVQSIRKWTDQGVRVHVLENWSTDGTYDLIRSLTERLPVTVERFPPTGPSSYFDWEAMLKRMEELSAEIEADWFVRRGADEILVSPWPGISYRDGLYLVDRAGFNCVDHTIIEFQPVDDGFQSGMDHEAYFRHFDFKHLSHHWQRKAWKNCDAPASSMTTAGHDVVFAGRRVFPFKFLLKHYAFRSQQHGAKKVFCERKPRWNPQERKRGWHIHYDSIKEGHRFLQSAADKEVFDEERFNKCYLVERLSGIGLARQKQLPPAGEPSLHPH